MTNTLPAGVIAALALFAAVSAATQVPAPPPVPATTPLGSGPYPAIMEADPGLATHTLYHPADLAADGVAKLPIVAWATGPASTPATASAGS